MTLKRFLGQIPLYILWALLAVILWIFIFGIVRDTEAEKKVVVFADVSAVRDTELAVELETAMPEGIRMVQVHPFSYAMISGDELTSADIYVVGEAQIAQYIASFAPLPEDFALPADAAIWSLDGTAYGVRVYDAAAGTGAMTEYLSYHDVEGGTQDYYLLFGAASVHIGDTDDAAVIIAEHMLELP